MDGADPGKGHCARLGRQRGGSQSSAAVRAGPDSPCGEVMSAALVYMYALVQDENGHFLETAHKKELTSLISRRRRRSENDCEGPGCGASG